MQFSNEIGKKVFQVRSSDRLLCSALNARQDGCALGEGHTSAPVGENENRGNVSMSSRDYKV